MGSGGIDSADGSRHKFHQLALRRKTELPARLFVPKLLLRYRTSLPLLIEEQYRVRRPIPPGVFCLQLNRFLFLREIPENNHHVIGKIADVGRPGDGVAVRKLFFVMISVRFSEMRYKVDMDTSLNRDPLQLLGNVALSLKELIARVPARQHHEVINEDMPAVFDSSGISHCVKEGEENFVGDSEIIALGGASNETKDRPLG